MQALGKNGHNISTEVWWTPSHPYKSSLTGVSASDLAKAYERASGRQWTQPIGFVHPAILRLASLLLHQRIARGGELLEFPGVAAAVGMRLLGGALVGLVNLRPR